MASENDPIAPKDGAAAGGDRPPAPARSTSFRGYLEDREISALIKAFVATGLVDLPTQNAIRSALDHGYRAAMTDNPTPTIQLFQNLSQMNRVHNLVNGDVPLGQYLTAATAIAPPTPESELIEAMLKRVRYSGQAPPAGSSITAAPTTGRVLSPAARQEAQTGAIDQTVSVDFLNSGVEAARSVVKILIHRHEGGQAEYLDGDKPRLVNGTGWFIAPGLVITNHHVINARRKEGVVEQDASPTDFRLQAEHAVLQLDYVREGTVSAEIATGSGTLQYSDAELDFALIRIPDPNAGRPPLRLRRNPIRKTLEQALGTRVNLLQHPNGKPMRLGFRNNYVVFGSNDSLSYLTDTAVGSSGSPVCDDSWTVAALHSGSRRISGQEVEILGHQYRRENFGTPIAAILAYLQQNSPALHEQIVAAQA